MTRYSRRHVVGGSLAMMAVLPTAARSRGTSALAPDRRRSFTPGRVWRDTAGKPISIHGGSIITVDGVFYWYGENKEFTTGKSDVWTWGVRCYRSTDLYNWDDLGLIIPPDRTDPGSPLAPSAFLDRPHIIRDPRTGRFVCWIKMLTDPFQTRAVLVADRITGPFRMISRDIRPLGMSAGDFDLVASPDDGKGYMYFERVHSEMICADLTDDYTGFSGYYSTHLPRRGPPDVREGLSYFRRGQKHYIVSSGTTGYFPNPSEAAVADTFHGPWTTMGDLHPSDRTRTSFNSQISSVFKHPAKRDLYIALADRWLGELAGSDFESGARSEIVQRAFAKYFAKPRLPLTPEETAAFTDGYFKINTSLAGHVWLPIRFDGDRPKIEWRDEWATDEFD